ncbi:hypothetical protein EYF80_024464 [Liparis tanakae]|uniref:Uncharacterized protein n=1 Tax=Liparis tanakae TaxID=230148 RepID=A0A4Z2HIE7_9TELE|nr:hypothetical protein EYF80_024464 [Liparis tanakae]
MTTTQCGIKVRYWSSQLIKSRPGFCSELDKREKGGNATLFQSTVFCAVMYERFRTCPGRVDFIVARSCWRFTWVHASYRRKHTGGKTRIANVGN